VSGRRSNEGSASQSNAAFASGASAKSSSGSASLKEELDRVDALAADVKSVQTLPHWSDEARLAGLVRTLEGEIVPRLLMSMVVSAHAERSPQPATPRTAPGDVAELARLLLKHDRSAAVAFIQMLRDGGTPLESIYVELLAPAARLLEELWDQQACDFRELAAGFQRLLSVLREFSKLRL
jgi:hypothetical protein